MVTSNVSVFTSLSVFHEITSNFGRVFDDVGMWMHFISHLVSSNILASIVFAKCDEF